MPIISRSLATISKKTCSQNWGLLHRGFEVTANRKRPAAMIRVCEPSFTDEILEEKVLNGGRRLEAAAA